MVGYLLIKQGGIRLPLPLPRTTRLAVIFCILMCVFLVVMLYSSRSSNVDMHYANGNREPSPFATGTHNNSNGNYVYPSSRARITLQSKFGGMHVLSRARELNSLESTHTPRDNLTTTVFMLYSEISSPLHDLFTLHKRATKYCDADTKVAGVCDVRLPRSYTYAELSLKLLDSLDIMCREPLKTDYYVKIDDDLIMSESMLDRMIRKMATTDCQVAGSIALDYAFYWPEGQIYIFTRCILETACKNMPYIADVYPNEDITFGLLLNSTDTSMFCDNMWPRNHWHKHYSDSRVEINYTRRRRQ